MTAAGRDQVVILGVDDNAADLRLTEEALRATGDNVTFERTRDGEEALRFLRRAPPFEDAPRPQLILLDLNMPRMSGMELLDELKADADLCNIPVIVVTSTSREQDIRGVYARHGNCYVVKPIGLDDFMDTMKEVLRFWRKTATVPRQG